MFKEHQPEGVSDYKPALGALEVLCSVMPLFTGTCSSGDKVCTAPVTSGTKWLLLVSGFCLRLLTTTSMACTCPTILPVAVQPLRNPRA